MTEDNSSTSDAASDEVPEAVTPEPVTPEPATPEPATPEVVTPDDHDPAASDEGERIEEPAKIIRIGSMIKMLLEELRQTELDEPSRERMRTIYETSITELGESLSPDLCRELNRLTEDFGDEGGEPPTGVELRIAQAQLVGWLEGLFQGIQATLMAQQVAANQQLQNMRGQLPPGTVAPGTMPAQGLPGSGAKGGGDDPNSRPGTYL